MAPVAPGESLSGRNSPWPVRQPEAGGTGGMAGSWRPRDRSRERVERSDDNRPIDPDLPLVDALRAGREGAFIRCVDRYYPAMLNLALRHVPSRTGAEEVVQEAWLGILKG